MKIIVSNGVVIAQDKIMSLQTKKMDKIILKIYCF